MKTFPKVGDQGYLRQFTGNYCVDMVKRPVTVIDVTPSTVTIQHAKKIAPIYHCVGNPYLDRPDLEGQRVWFYDTVAESIEPDPDGYTEVLTWHSKRNRWGTPGSDKDYPEYLVTEQGYQHQPYLD